MTTSISTPLPHRRATPTRSAAIVILGLLATFLTFGGSAEASLNTLELVEEAFDTLGTTGDEWSGATYNADNHSLFVVDDEGFGFEFGLDPTANTVVRSQAREVTIDIESGDFEGVAWISGNTYGLLSEDSGRIYVIDISPNSSYFDADDALAVVETGISDSNNKGAEGLATDGEYFYVAKEWPPVLHRFSPDSTWNGGISLSGHLADISGVAVAANGSFIVLSDQSRTVTTLDIDWDNETASPISSLNVATFNKAEGIAVLGNEDLYVFGELSNQTYGHWEGTVADDSGAEIVFTSGDANCSGTIAIDDAYIISRVAVQLEEVETGCSADANKDGVINILDAYDVARCAVNHPECSIDLPPSPPT